MSEEEKRELFKEHKGLVIYYDTYVKVKEYYKLHQENTQLKSVLKEIREYINNYDVFKEVSFPLMKRDVENQIKASIKYEFVKSINKVLLVIID